MNLNGFKLTTKFDTRNLTFGNTQKLKSSQTTGSLPPLPPLVFTLNLKYTFHVFYFNMIFLNYLQIIFIENLFTFQTICFIPFDI